MCLVRQCKIGYVAFDKRMADNVGLEFKGCVL